jgi:hypothetical protein
MTAVVPFGRLLLRENVGCDGLYFSVAKHLGFDNSHTFPKTYEAAGNRLEYSQSARSSITSTFFGTFL